MVQVRPGVGTLECMALRTLSTQLKAGVLKDVFDLGYVRV
jgi:hypothetical protein